MANRVKNGTKHTRNTARGTPRGVKGPFATRILVAASNPKADGTAHRVTITKRQQHIAEIYDALKPTVTPASYQQQAGRSEVLG